MFDVTLVLPIRAEEVLLGMKLRGFGAGWWNGFGGKPKGKETILEAAVRELKEESRLLADPRDLIPIGRIEFYFPEKPAWDQTMHTYILESWQGEPGKTKEMDPHWFMKGAFPEQKMWPADKYLFPMMLDRQYVAARVYFIGEGDGVRRIELLQPREETIEFPHTQTLK